MGRDFFHTDRKGVTNNLIKKTVPPFRLPQYIQNDSEPLPDLGIIFGKMVWVPEITAESLEQLCARACLYVCYRCVILPKIIHKRALFN